MTEKRRLSKGTRNKPALSERYEPELKALLHLHSSPHPTMHSNHDDVK